MDALYDEADLLQPVIVSFDIFVLESFEFKLFQVIAVLHSMLDLWIPKFVIKCAQPLLVE